jgi:hypothetical protein
MACTSMIRNTRKTQSIDKLLAEVLVAGLQSRSARLIVDQFDEVAAKQS